MKIDEYQPRLLDADDPEGSVRNVRERRLLAEIEVVKDAEVEGKICRKIIFKPRDAVLF